MTKYQFMSVEEWGGEWARPPQYEQPNDPEGYLHQTAGNPYWNSDAKTAFRALNAFAIHGKNYSFMDYDVAVHVDKMRDIVTIGEGRGKYMSAATKDRNELGEAVVVFGWFQPPVGSGHYSAKYAERPDIRHVTGAAMGFHWLAKEGLLRANAILRGHRDNPAHPGDTSCPGDYWYDYDASMGATPFNKMVDVYHDLLNPPTIPPEVIAMAETMNVAIVRDKDHANQYILLEINMDNRKRWGIDHSPVVLDMTDAQIAAIEKQNGNKMTKL